MGWGEPIVGDSANSLPDLLKIYPRARVHLSIDAFDRERERACIKFREVKILKGLLFQRLSLFIPLPSTRRNYLLPRQRRFANGIYRIFLRLLFLCFSFEFHLSSFSSFRFSFEEWIDLKETFSFCFFILEFLIDYSVNLIKLNENWEY